ncbi:MAG: metallophosphoesterase [Reichenbachiella sp.]
MKYVEIILVLLIAIAGCQENQVPRIVIEHQYGASPMSGKGLKNDPKAFQIAIVTDRTGGHREGVFPDAMHKLNLLQPEFVMSVGDLIEGYTENESVINQEWDQMDRFIDQLNMPFFYLPGNHDYTNEVMANIWEKRLGPSYYHFVYKDVLFTCLNSMDPHAEIGEEQIDWIKKIIKENKKCRWNLVFVHHPLWQTEGEETWKQIEEIFKTGPDYTVFAGHHHRYVKHVRDDHKHITLATTGGASNLGGPSFGEFDHVVWLTMNENGPVIANLLLEGIWDENVVTEQKRLFNSIISNPNNMKLHPILFEDEIKEGEVRMRIVNDFDVPLKMEFDLNKKTNFNLNQAFPRTVTLKPNDVYILESQAIFSQPKTDDELIATVKWKAVVADPQGLEVELNGDLGLNIAKLLPGPTLTKSKKIDGILNDWNETFTVVNEPSQVTGDEKSWIGPEDGRYKFSMAYDESMVYFAVQVFDDQVLSEKEEYPWYQDGIEIRLDTRERSISAVGQGNGEGEDILLIAISPNKNANEDAWLSYQKDKLPEGTQYVCVETNEGFNAEFAIPFSYFEQSQGKNWEDFRFNICVDDTDNDGFVQLWWQPSWKNKNNKTGSGIFLKK